MAEQGQNQTPAKAMARPLRARPAAATGSAASLTPKEIFGILRRHILLMVSMTILGFIIGGASWFLLLRYAPKYTAETFIRVLPPVQKDPLSIGQTQVNKEIQYGYRLSMAALIRQQSSLRELIDRDKIRETEWFANFGQPIDKAIRKAFKDLKKNFSAYAQRDGDFIVLQMTCGNKKEAALIVNEMMDLFLASQGSTKKEEIAEKLAGLGVQRLRLQRDVDSAERALDAVRTRYGIFDLEEREWQPTVTQKLNALEMDQDSLMMDLTQVQANIETLREQATGPITKQVEQQIESDPVMVMLAQQLALQESTLAGLLTKFGENHKTIRQARELINAIRKERQIRKTKIAEQTRQSNLKNMQDTLVGLQRRYEELENLRNKALAKQKDFDEARIQYEQRLIIKDERQARLDETKAQIESYKIIHDDPETPKVQKVGYAPVPLEVSSPKWKLYFP